MSKHTACSWLLSCIVISANLLKSRLRMASVILTMRCGTTSLILCCNKLLVSIVCAIPCVLEVSFLASLAWRSRRGLLQHETVFPMTALGTHIQQLMMPAPQLWGNCSRSRHERANPNNQADDCGFGSMHGSFCEFHEGNSVFWRNVWILLFHLAKFYPL